MVAPGRLLNRTFLAEGLPVRLALQQLSTPYKLHWHEFYELSFVLSGRAVNTVNGVPHALKSGSMFLLTPADFHELAPEPGEVLQLYNLNFSDALLSPAIIELVLLHKDAVHAQIEDGEERAAIRIRFAALAAELPGQRAGRDIAVVGELNRLLIDWHRHRRPSGRAAAGAMPSGPCHAGIRKALLYLHYHFRQQISLQDVAGAAHLSCNYFSELFHKSTGLTFQHYLQGLRLDFAHALLRSSALPVTEVSLIAGFNTLSHFERLYRVRFGGPPSQTERLHLA